MSDDPQVIRAVLREHGHDVPVHGRIGKALMDEYERITGSAPDYDAGVSDADFTDVAEAELPGEPDGEGVEAETRPKRTTRRQSRPSGGGWFGKPKAKRAAKRGHPVSPSMGSSRPYGKGSPGSPSPSRSRSASACPTRHPWPG